MHSKRRVCRVCKHTKKAKQTVLLSWAEREYDRRSTEVGIKQELDAVVELFQTQELEDSSLDVSSPSDCATLRKLKLELRKVEAKCKKHPNMLKAIDR